MNARAMPRVGELFGHFQRDVLALNSAFSEILKYSLLRRDPTASTLKTHRLVQAVLIKAHVSSREPIAPKLTSPANSRPNAVGRPL